MGLPGVIPFSSGVPSGRSVAAAAGRPLSPGVGYLCRIFRSVNARRARRPVTPLFFAAVRSFLTGMVFPFLTPSDRRSAPFFLTAP